MEEDWYFILQPKADHHGSKVLLRDLCWIVTNLVEKVLPKKSILCEIYHEAQWQIDDR